MFITVRFRNVIFAFLLLCTVSGALSVLGTLRTQTPAQAVLAPAERGEVLILDPGHGGLDGGAVGIDGTVESAVNLEIALKMRDLARLFGREVVMTRESEALDYPDEEASIAAKKVSDQKARAALINRFPDACMISVHQNTYPSPAVHGAQVFYRPTPESQTLAERIQAAINEKLIPGGRRVAAPISKDIYLMKSINCTAVLVECGFLSNPAECAQLKDSDYQTKLAMTMLSAYLMS